MEEVRLWPKNLLPTPFPRDLFSEEEGDEINVVNEVYPEDNFPKGRVVKYFVHQGYGFVKDRAGKDRYFNLSEVELIGEKERDEIKVGMTVGYDLAHAGKTQHVKKMKLY